MKRKQKRGSFAVEMAFSLLMLMPMLMGTSVIGMNLLRAIQVTQFCRDLAHMYAYGVDFSQSANQTLLTHLAQGLNVQTSGGNGVVVFSTISYVYANDCTAAGYTANTTSCKNLNQNVYVRRFIVGNPSKMSSHWGTPPSNIIQSGGYINASDYLQNTSDRVSSFGMQLDPGKLAYLTEVYVAAPDIDWRGYMSGTGSYAFNIF